MATVDEQLDQRPRLLLVGPLPPPYIGPAVATERMAASRVINNAFRTELVDTSDPGGQGDIGRLTLHNVFQAFQHLWRFFRTLLRFRPDVVYISIARGFWGFVRDLALILPARLFGAKVVVHLRAGRFDLIHDYGIAGRMAARIGLGAVCRALVLGEATRDVFGAYIPAEKVKIVPNGIALDAWPIPAEPGASEESVHIVYLANLYPDKGTHVMIEALPEIARYVPNVVVSFAGAWQNADYKVRCERAVAEYGIERHVRFLGVVASQAKRDLLESADIVAFVPVAPEGSPWVVLEAMASARPVIGTPQGTMRETIVDGETGYLIEPGNPAALAASVIALARDPALRRQLGWAGRRRVEEHYAEGAMHALLADVLAEAVMGSVNEEARIRAPRANTYGVELRSRREEMETDRVALRG